MEIKSECPICQEAGIGGRLFPCSHFLCWECIGRLQKNLCPFCRSPLPLIITVKESDPWEGWEEICQAYNKELEVPRKDSLIYAREFVNASRCTTLKLNDYQKYARWRLRQGEYFEINSYVEKELRLKRIFRTASIETPSKEHGALH